MGRGAATMDVTGLQLFVVVLVLIAVSTELFVRNRRF